MNSAAVRQLSQHIDHSRQVSGNDPGGISMPVMESQIYIGLNDSETKQQKLATDRYAAILKEICRDFGVPFSFNVIDGGYIHDNGEYTEEKSIVLTFIDLPQETVDKIAKEVCILFHQESVLVTTDRIRVRSIRERL